MRTSHLSCGPGLGEQCFGTVRSVIDGRRRGTLHVEVVASECMVGGVRFDDLEPAEMVDFLDEARRHLELDPSSADLGPEWADLAPVWGCRRCGSEHPIDDMIVVKGEPRCPHCDAEGWKYVIPLARE